MEINSIIDKIKNGDFRFSLHAIEMTIKRGIDEEEVEEAIINGEIIEEYPEDKYSPSCLVYGKTNRGRNLHVLCSIPPKVVIVTTYEPDSAEWIDCKLRRT